MPTDVYFTQFSINIYEGMMYVCPRQSTLDCFDICICIQEQWYQYAVELTHTLQLLGKSAYEQAFLSVFRDNLKLHKLEDIYDTPLK